MKREISRNMTPSVLGGGIISHVERENYTIRSDIKAFEAGTGNIAGVIGVGEAVRFIESIQGNKKDNIINHTRKLIEIFLNKIKDLNESEDFKINIFAGQADRNVGIISFQTIVNGKEIHPHDVAEIFARYNIQVRAGHHCAEPLMNYFNIPSGLTRISFHIYNNENDIEKVIFALKEVKNIFRK